MEGLNLFIDKTWHLYACLLTNLSSSRKHFSGFTKRLYRFLVFHTNPFITQLVYFISISVAGFLALRIQRPKHGIDRPKNLDLFFMSVSASTVSSMSTVEMEAFSEPQLWVLIVLMVVGGEILTSMLGLQFTKAKQRREDKVSSCIGPGDVHELDLENNTKNSTMVVVTWSQAHSPDRIVRHLSVVLLAYLTLINMSGFVSICLYLILVHSAGDILRSRGIRIFTFSIFTAVSSFGNCGFIPTNENMTIFRKDSILLLLIIPQVLAGSTLFPLCLRLMVRVLKKLTGKQELEYMLQNPRELGYKHLLSSSSCVNLGLTVVGFIVVQFVLFCSLEWDSLALKGMSSFEKFVGALFQSVNSRYAGESIVDLSTLSPAVLVLYIVMMYLPPYTSFLLLKDDELPSEKEKEVDKGRELLKKLIFSQLSYLVIFSILLCITERPAMFADPLNFNVLNIVFEVISAYGNVGYSVGYSCKKMQNRDSKCKDAWNGFAGRWSNKGKLILILVMIFGRLKNFNMKGGSGWKLN